MSELEILDCTLRDASYPIAYQFTAEDTAVIAAGLEDAGLRKIEVGHGLGLGASTPAIGVAAATDREYLEAAAAVLSRAKFGAFFIPGIADRSHLELAADCGAGFLRIGTDVTETENAEPFIRRARERGLEVSCNLMKTYALPIDDVLRRSEALDRWGAQVICIVDSAGGMLPHEVRESVRRLGDSVGARVGFHGHNNLQLAVANAVAAVEAGATVVDSTLRGMGRSSGNAQTEALVLILRKLGYDLGVDLFKLMDLGDKLIGPIARGRGVDSVELTCGYAQFHSSFLKIVERVAAETGIDPRELILRVSEIDKVQVTEELVRRVAAEVRRGSAQAPVRPARRRSIELDLAPREVAVDPIERAREVAGELRTLAKKTGLRSVFTIAPCPQPTGGGPRFPFIRSGEAAVVGNAEVESLDQAVAIAAAVDGLVDYILIDAEEQPRPEDHAGDRVRAAVHRSKVLSYRDAQAQIDAVEALVGQLFPALSGVRVAVCGVSGLGLKVAVRLLERGADVGLWDPDAGRMEAAVRALGDWSAAAGSEWAGECGRLDPARDEVDLLLGTTPRLPVVTREVVAAVVDGGTIIDAGVGSLGADAVAAATGAERGLNLYRLDMRAGLAAQVALTLETVDLVDRVLGRAEVAGAEIVAGGTLGGWGTVVVDEIREPTRVLGIADGRGHLLADPEAAALAPTVAAVKGELLRRRLPWPAANSVA